MHVQFVFLVVLEHVTTLSFRDLTIFALRYSQPVSRLCRLGYACLASTRLLWFAVVFSQEAVSCRSTFSDLRHRSRGDSGTHAHLYSKGCLMDRIDYGEGVFYVWLRLQVYSLKACSRITPAPRVDPRAVFVNNELDLGLVDVRSHFESFYTTSLLLLIATENVKNKLVRGPSRPLFLLQPLAAYSRRGTLCMNYHSLKLRCMVLTTTTRSPFISEVLTSWSTSYRFIVSYHSSRSADFSQSRLRYHSNVSFELWRF